MTDDPIYSGRERHLYGEGDDSNVEEFDTESEDEEDTNVKTAQDMDEDDGDQVCVSGGKEAKGNTHLFF